MLSPPYSPHADLIGVLALERGAKDVPKSIVSRVNPTSSSQSTSFSHSISGDELTDNDFEDDGASSGSVASDDDARKSFKRSSSDAFLDERGSQDSTDTAFIESSDEALRETRSVPMSRAPSPTDVRERRMTTCWDSLKTNPAKYLRRERSLLEMYPLRRHSWAGPASPGFSSEDNGDMMSGAAMAAAAVASASGSGAGSGRRGRRAYRTPSNASSAASSGSAARGRRRASPFDGSASDTASATGDESGTQRSSGLGNAGVRVHDLNLSQIKDYAPPSSSLPPGKSLRAEWKGAPMDLSNDPDLHLLHPAEAHLASVLRLPCDVYLDSKRRLFAEKVHRLKQGLPFRRTDSQKACRIDVNKASRLFGAFEKIGWLEDELFMKFLD